jgi:predicted MFS family arabinose efflux permease
MWTAAAVSFALLLVALIATRQNIVPITLLWGFCLSASELVYVTLAMAKSDRRVGAGHFAIFMAISNIGVGIGQSITTGLIDTVDFRWIFGVLAVVNLLSFPLLTTMRSDEKSERPKPAFTVTSSN